MRGVPHPSKWPEPLWLALEVLIVSNGLLALEDDVVCTPEVEARMAQAGIPGKIDVAGIPTGDNAAYLDALHATMARLVAMERLFLGDAQDDEAAPAVKPLSTAEGMDRSLTVKQARMFARSEHEHMCVRACVRAFVHAAAVHACDVIVPCVVVVWCSLP